MSFRVLKRSSASAARLGTITTPHGRIRTPAFMPIATYGAVKALGPDDLRAAHADIILSNTYHLSLRPGMDVLRRAGGLHTFMGWDGPILTDSGGYQVFSLSRSRTISNRGVAFADDRTRRTHLLTPERAIDIQRDIGSDIMMILDECPAYPASRAQATRAQKRTTAWAARSLKQFRSQRLVRKHMLFGIIQGSTYKDQRIAHARAMTALPFDGFAIGGVAVGEPSTSMDKVVRWTAPELPVAKPRYLMGVGYPDQLVRAVRAGIDMFDCVLPTRNARHGSLFVWKKASLTGTFWQEMSIRAARYRTDMRPIDPSCPCPACSSFSRAYIRHLLLTKEPLGIRLATLHNVTFILTVMERIRSDIRAGRL